MAMFCVGASTQYILSTPVISDLTTPPFTVGLWCNLTAASNVNRTLWALTDTGTASQIFGLRMNTTENLQITAQASGSINNAAVSPTLTAGTWNFCVARFISATNRRLSVLHGNGEIASAQSTVNLSPLSIDTMSIGALNAGPGISEPWDGGLAEYWLTKSDIQPGGGALEDATIRQLAYGGPFSVPHIAKDIIEYRSFRKSLISDSDNSEDVFHGSLGRQLWTQTGSPTVSSHAPLPYWYIKPGQTKRHLTV